MQAPRATYYPNSMSELLGPAPNMKDAHTRLTDHEPSTLRSQEPEEKPTVVDMPSA